jgi:hypothetical protein
MDARVNMLSIPSFIKEGTWSGTLAAFPFSRLVLPSRWNKAKGQRACASSKA